MKIKYRIQIRESGYVLEEVSSLEYAIEFISAYRSDNPKDKDFYEIVMVID